MGIMKFLSGLSNGRLFGRYLLVTNTVSAGMLMGLGDITIQRVEHMRSEKSTYTHNWARTGRMMGVGFLLGPVNHAWYISLDKVLVGTGAKTIAKKILADQIFASPTFAFLFFMGMGTLELKPVEHSWSEFKQNFWEVYKMDWTVWPAAQAVNFYFLPTKYRVLYVAFITLGWDTYLSFVKHKKKDDPDVLPSNKSVQNKNSSTDTVTMVTKKVSMVKDCGSEVSAS